MATVSSALHWNGSFPPKSLVGKNMHQLKMPDVLVKPKCVYKKIAHKNGYLENTDELQIIVEYPISAGHAVDWKATAENLAQQVLVLEKDLKATKSILLEQGYHHKQQEHQWIESFSRQSDKLLQYEHKLSSIYSSRAYRWLRFLFPKV